ncbi:protease complex subunit PrcB family protein [Lachnoclostridium phytofermentans]|uniref:PrcB C-terminal domain-containing protein n=1 Tax=Lachnoclostridium phytofermentans (strain ATCC 700394 / DSM 18823 / ISDg) TaxID=357809 RepID=A9KL11_LACP7|nr:protease complex subunit PrcB family protein [Lachnoclostridium phytofermentans]ABX44160.1 hypothetical protein Cphy_3813 [Lachnoclostridium phytofermentans ISDg]
MKHIIKQFLLFSCLLVLSALLISCKKTNGTPEKERDLEFTVVENADLPDKLLKCIEDKKANPFKLTYENEDYLYIVQGYGAQKSGGYSISVDELYLAGNWIYVKTSLIGPGKNEPVTQNITYPYVVIKTEFMDNEVCFQ